MATAMKVNFLETHFIANHKNIKDKVGAIKNKEGEFFIQKFSLTIRNIYMLYISAHWYIKDCVPDNAIPAIVKLTQ